MSDIINEEPPATREDFAALDFEPVGPEIRAGFRKEPWEAQCRTHGIALRLAVGIVEKTKAELIEGVRKLSTDDDGMTAFFEGLDFLQEAKKSLVAFAELLEAAYIRELAAAAAALGAEPEVTGFGEPDERPPAVG